MGFSQLLARQLHTPKGIFGRLIGRFMNHLNKEMYAQARDVLAFKSDDEVLEIGFGNGAFIGEMAQLVSDGMYYGVDHSPTMLRVASRKNKGLIDGQKVKLFQGSASKLPLADNSVSKAFTINTIYFWKDPEEVMLEVKRVLRSGGSFVISLNTKAVMEANNYDSSIFTFYTKEDVIQLFEKTGFCIGKTAYQRTKLEDALCIEGIAC